MSSKPSPSNNLWRNVWGELRRRIWVAICAFTVFLFVLPLSLTLTLQNERFNLLRDSNHDWLRPLNEIFASSHSFTVVALILFACVAGLVFFSYLMNMRQVDFYHSQPRSRSCLFAEHYLAGWLSVVVPYLISLLLCLGVTFAMGMSSGLDWVVFFISTAIHLLCFSAIYSVFALAAILSGTTLLQLLLSGFLLLAAPVAICLFRWVRSFLQPAWYPLADFRSLVVNSSVLTRYCNQMQLGDSITWAEVNALIATAVVWIAAALILALLLYRRRPLECAGRALAFSRTRVLFKYPIVIFASLLLGLLLHEIGDWSGSTNIWYFVGVILGGIIAAQAIEVLYVFDIHGLFRKWWASVLVVALLCCGSYLLLSDIFVYNRYIPDTVEVVAVDTNLSVLAELGQNDYLMEAYSPPYVPGYRDEESPLVLDKNILLARSHSTDQSAIAATVAIAQKILEQQKEEDDIQQLYSTDMDTHTYTRLTVRYYLADGSEKVRQYQGAIDICQIKEEIDLLLTADDYRNNLYALFGYDSQQIRLANVSSFVGEWDRSYYDTSAFQRLINLDIDALLETYAQDLRNLQPEELRTDYPIGQLSFVIFESDPGIIPKTVIDSYTLNCDYRTVDYPLYASMHNTLAALGDLGYDDTYWRLDPASAARIQIRIDKEEEISYLESIIPGLDMDSDAWSVTDDYYSTVDTAQIVAIIQHCIPSSAGYFAPLLEVNYNIDIEVYYSTPEGNGYAYFYPPAH